MTFSSTLSLRATSFKHHDRGLTLVFGSDGQVSLIGLDGGFAPQTFYTLTAGNTGALTSGTQTLPSEPTSASLIPNLEASSASLTGTSSSTLISSSTPIPSSLASSSYNPSSTTDTDTNLPSIPTINYPTPDPTPVSNPKDHGVGAPFYLAIVLASISFIGCIAAFIAWWIRSRARKRDLELDDPWNNRDTISDAGSPFTNNTNASKPGPQTHMETQTRPYYLPASIVRRSSSNLLAVPHTIPTLEDNASQNGTPREVLDAGRYPPLRRANNPRSQNSGSEPNPYQHAPSSRTTIPYSRPGNERLQTGLSVQESTRTLGRLRVANRVPGDVTSGDEGGMNGPHLQSSAVTNISGPDAVPVGEGVMHNTHPGQDNQPVQKGDSPLEPPGPATLPWGRRTDTVAALRRTQRRAPGMTVQTYKNARYSGYLYPTLDGGPIGATGQAPAEERIHANPPSDPLGWKNTLRSSFWQAVDAMTGNRPSDPESNAVYSGSGSRFTPAPQRVASRRSPVSPVRPVTSAVLPDTRIIQSPETGAKYQLTLPDKSVATGEMPQNLSHPSFGTSTRGNEPETPRINDVNAGRVGSLPPKVSHLNRDFGKSMHGQYSDSLRTDTGSLYSTDSAAARANLRKYGYGDPIPSSWSALAATRESQLDLDRMYLPLPRPISSSPSPLSVTPSQLTFASGLLSSSVSTRTRTHTPMQSVGDLIASDASTLRSSKNVETTTGSTYSMSRNGTIQSGRGTIGHGTVPSHSASTSSSMLSRKKGVTARRKRPRLPPRASSTASSVQSMESGLSVREVAVRRALLERRKKVKAAESLKGRKDSLVRGRDSSNFLL